MRESVELALVISLQSFALRAGSGRLHSRTFLTFEPASEISLSKILVLSAFFYSLPTVDLISYHHVYKRPL